MEYTQFRLGNLLQDGVSKTLLKVIEVSEKDLTTYVIDRSMFPLKSGWFTEYIPLTEEWLINFGFHQDENGWHRMTVMPSINKEILTIHINSKTFVTSTFGDEALEPSYFKECKHVHQLQNLYFALTGKELNIIDL